MFVLSNCIEMLESTSSRLTFDSKVRKLMEESIDPKLLMPPHVYSEDDKLFIANIDPDFNPETMPFHIYGVELCLAYTGLDVKLNRACLRSIANNRTTNDEKELKEIGQEDMMGILEDILSAKAEMSLEDGKKQTPSVKSMIENAEKKIEQGNTSYDFLPDDLGDYKFNKQEKTLLLDAFKSAKSRTTRNLCIRHLKKILSKEEAVDIFKPVLDSTIDLDLKEYLSEILEGKEDILGDKEE